MQRTHFKRVLLLLYYFSSSDISRHFRQHDSYSSEIARYLNISTWWWIDIYYIDMKRSWNFPHPIKVQRTTNEQQHIDLRWMRLNDNVLNFDTGLCLLFVYFLLIYRICMNHGEKWIFFTFPFTEIPLETKWIAQKWMQMVLFCAGGSPSSINLYPFDQLNSKQGCAYLTMYHDLNTSNLNARTLFSVHSSTVFLSI